MTHLLVDTSVLIKWFHEVGESEVAEARSIREAHVSGELTAHLLDLGVYEVGNVLVRALRWSADDVAAQIDDLLAIAGSPLTMAPTWFGRAAQIAEQHGLSFYDSCWAAAAEVMRIPLISADRRLLNAGLAQSATEYLAQRGSTS